MATESTGRPLCRCLLPVVAVLAVFGAAGPSVAAGADADLWGCSWELSTWGYSARGVAVWVVGESGVRLDVMSSDLPPEAALKALWRQEGRGWTMVTSNSVGVSGAWGREWRPLDRAEADLVERLAAELPPFLAGQGTSRKIVIRRPQPFRGCSAFHSDLVIRGLGQGGAGEILHLDRQLDLRSHVSVQHLSLSSSRRPGDIQLGLFRLERNLGDLPPEIFAPLWPLDEFLEFPSQIPELSRTEGVESSAVLQGGKPAGANP